jgi:hypothetical protein
LARRVASVVGGQVDEPHVTVAYLEGAADPDDVAQAVVTAGARPATVRAAGLLGLSEQPNPVFGHALFMSVERSPALGRLHRALAAAVAPLGLRPTFPWEQQRTHLRLVLAMPRRPSDALARLGMSDVELRFRAARLRLTRMVDGRIEPIAEIGLG